MAKEHDPPAAPQERSPQQQRHERARLISTLVVGAVVVVFALVNLSSVKVDWIVGSAHSPLILVIVVSFLLGTAFGRPLLRRLGQRNRR